MGRYTKAFECEIENDGKISFKKEIHLNKASGSLEGIMDIILKTYHGKNIGIKKYKPRKNEVFQGNKNKPHLRHVVRIPPKQGTTEWVYLIKEDGTVWNIDDNGHGQRFVGERIDIPTCEIGRGIIVRKILIELESKYGRSIPLNEILEAASINGLDETQVRDIIKNLLIKGDFFALFLGRF